MRVSASGIAVRVLGAALFLLGSGCSRPSDVVIQVDSIDVYERHRYVLYPNALDEARQRAEAEVAPDGNGMRPGEHVRVVDPPSLAAAAVRLQGLRELPVVDPAYEDIGIVIDFTTRDGSGKVSKQTLGVQSRCLWMRTEDGRYYEPDRALMAIVVEHLSASEADEIKTKGACLGAGHDRDPEYVGESRDGSASRAPNWERRKPTR